MEDFEEALKDCYPGTDVLLICFSHSEPDSFENIRTVWLKELKLDGLRKDPVGSKSHSMHDNVLLSINFFRYFWSV